ncbi:MAG: DNA-directed DNA polymerase I [Nitrososphaeria archaeon]
MSFEQLEQKITSLTAHTRSLDECLLVSAGYDGDEKKVYLMFYSPKLERIFVWKDNTGHKPYCFTKADDSMLAEVRSRPDIVEITDVVKNDMFSGKQINVRKIIVTNPLSIGGGKGEQSIRNILPCYEADIKYYENYIYDFQYTPGTFFRIEEDKPIPVTLEADKRICEDLESLKKNTEKAFVPYVETWSRLLTQPLPKIKRASLDIEVASPEESHIPSPSEAEHMVIAVAMYGSDGRKKVFLVNRKEVPVGETKVDDADILFYDDEKALLEAVFLNMLDYPFIITYNGDEFDLNYLYHRARNLGFSDKAIPISLGRDQAWIKHGVHIDLYKFFSNHALKVYVFDSKYVENTLNSVCEALINESKIEFEGNISDLPLMDLAKYCFNDCRITFMLTSYSNDLVIRLLTVIARVAKMPFEDLGRLGVSNWIRSLMYFEHRRMNALIPLSQEVSERGVISSTAITKGKKYRGAYVLEPEAGVHFNVAVLDFASLYPSIIKVYNLSYETILCGHPECKSNIIPDTPHWVCKKRHGITSMLIGSLRDLRVKLYKPLTKRYPPESDEATLFNTISQVLKVILNASYGVFGTEAFPLYCPPVAESTAAIGRYLITRTVDECRRRNIRVVYGDTDSLFVSGITKEEIEKMIGWAEDNLGIELDLDKVYKYVAFSKRKKNYLGVLPNGNFILKGFTGKKSNTPKFIKDAFYDVVGILSKVNSQSEFEAAREEVKKYLKNITDNLRRKKIPLEDLSFNVMIGKGLDEYVDTTPQHVKAAKQLERSGKKVKGGDIISFVKTTTPEGVKPTSLARPEEIDANKYIEYMRSTFEQLLDALGYDFDEVITSTKLEDFFWS